MNEKMIEVLLDHYCTPGCENGCNIAKTRYFRTKTEYIYRDPLTEETHATIRARVQDILR